MRRRRSVLALALASILAFVFLGASPAQANGAGPLSQSTYVALGDSYPAGALLPSPDYAYPAVLANGLANVNLQAHSGESVSSLLSSLQASSPDPTVRWVTLTVGANDTAWQQELANCVAAGSACNYLGVIATLNQGVNTVSPKLPQVLTEINRVYPRATIYWSGYVRPFVPSSLRSVCQVPLGGGNSAQVPALMGVAIDATIVNFNSRVISAVLQANLQRIPARYVAADPQFNGHRYCNPEPEQWLFLLHPTIEGQRAYARAFTSAGMASN